MRRAAAFVVSIIALLMLPAAAGAQRAASPPLPQKAPVTAKQAPKVKKPRPVPAKVLFKRAKVAAALPAGSFGRYNRGCLAGGMKLAETGPNWQAMRLSRNRNWGHPRLVKVVERLAHEANKLDGWPGLLVGDLSMPRGGPMPPSHASHQIGLDADIWLTPMPARTLSRKEREAYQPQLMVKGPLGVNDKVFSEKQLKLIKRMATYREVAKVGVNHRIKLALCRMSAGKDRNWLAKVRPWRGHVYHMHVRIRCPAGNAGCVGQKPIVEKDGGCAYMEKWYRNTKAYLERIAKNPPKKKKKKVVKKRKRKPPVTLAQLPAACRVVLNAAAPAARPALRGTTADTAGRYGPRR